MWSLGLTTMFAMFTITMTTAWGHILTQMSTGALLMASP